MRQYGEHQAKQQKVCENHGVELEYTAPYTPQMNRVVERRIAVLLNGARTVMYSDNLTDESRKKIWAQAVNYIEEVRNSMATTRSLTSSDEIFFGKKPTILPYMVEFGRIGYVTIRNNNIKKQTDERDIKDIIVGYTKRYSGDTYRIFNPNTKRIILTRDIKWAKWKITDPKSNMDVFVKYDSSDIVPGIDEVVVGIAKLPEINRSTIHLIPDDDGYQNNEDSRKVKFDENLTDPKNQATRLEREMKKLDSSYNTMVIGNEEKESIKEGNVVVTGNAKSLPIEIPEIKMMDFTKWVFKTKLEANGTESLKSRIVIKGYLQVPCVDFIEKFSPVATDTSTPIIIGLTL